MSTINVTVKTFFEHLYLVPELTPIYALCNHALGGAQPEWIYSQGVYFQPRAGGEVRMFGVDNNKQANKQTK